jgi:ligand-binding sensor domain-containing protein/signal transduction histidine kinase/DNA-binding response OmpR family regulator
MLNAYSNYRRNCHGLMLFKIIGICIVVGLFASPLNAQNLNMKFKHLNGTQGLSNSTIEAIYQDSRGFMWFGTRDGLNRFDGYKVNVFRNHINDLTSLSDNYIKCIYEDKNHNLWIGTLNGLNRYNPYANSFIRYKHSPQPNSIASNEVTCIYSDKKNNLWIGTGGGGLDFFDIRNQRFKHFKHHDNSFDIPGDDVNCLFEDTHHNLWVGTNNGLSKLNRTTGRFSGLLNINGRPDITITYPILKIQEDKLGNIWLGTASNGLIVINLTTHKRLQYQHNDRDPQTISSNLIRALLIDNQGVVWSGGINGSLDRFNFAGKTFYHAQNEANNPQSLSQKTISSLLEDNQNNLWVGTHRGGVNFYAPLANKFQLLQQQPTDNSLSYNDVKAFYEDNEANLWIGTDGGGLNLFDEQSNNFRHFRYNVYDTKSLSSDAVLNINQDRYGNLWIGTWGGGLNLMSRNKKTFRHFTHKPADKYSISSNYVQTMLQDSEGNFWVATYYGGLNILDTRSYRFKRITSDSLKQTSLYGNNIVSLNEDKEKNLWIGTDDGGLNCYNLPKKKFTHYFVNGEKTPDLRVIFTDSKGRTWVGQTGLYLFNKFKNQFELYTEKGGLSTEFIKGVTEDESGNLWISTSNGLTKFNPETYALKKYNIADGLQELEFEAGAFMKTKKGEMFFGGINGFNKFYPHNIKLNQVVAPVYITDLSIFNQSIYPGQKDGILKNDISLTHQINLNYTQSTISFDFAILNYAAPENNQYAYKLANFNDVWHYSYADRKASYTNLGPGEYTFYVKASNNDGVWNNTPAYIRVIISPPFWATWWFRLLMFLTVSGLAYFLLRFKKNLDMQKIEENRRDEMHKMQLQFFTNISHEFRTPLSLILGPLEKMIDQDNRSTFNQYYDTIHRNANRLLLLINELMDFRKAETGALKLKVMPGNINLFIDEVAEDFKNLAIQKNIRLKLIIGREIGEAWFDRQILEKIILNLVDNAFKYTNTGGDITIELYTNANQFVSTFEHQIVVNNTFRAKKNVFIRVSDNGIGITKESIVHLFERYYRTSDTHMGSGVGLAFVKSLTLLHKGSIYVYSKRNIGTDFIISLPIGKDDYLQHEKWILNAADNHIQLESISASFSKTEFKSADDLTIKSADMHNSPEVYKILIVDDNDELRNFLYNSLSEFYEVIAANDGAEGLSKVREEMPDLIISDLMMPEMDGMEFCRQVKTEPRTNQIPFVILSAKDAIESKIEGAGLGADLYFPKPVSLQLLLLSIKNILEQRRVLKERYLKNYFVEAQELTDLTSDREFMDHFIQLVESQLSNSDLDVDYLCREMGMSKTKLYHKIKRTSGQSIGEFVRTFRLKKAAYIITHEDVLLTDAMYRVGIQTQSYFTKAFKKEFGKTPSQFLHEIKKSTVTKNII